jgi:two-component system sensor histidine kinase MprB
VAIVGPSQLVLPVDGKTRSIAASGSGQSLRSATVEGAHLRLLTVGLPGGGALELARPLSGVDNALRHLRLVLVILCAGGVALAAGLGLAASRRIIAPISRLTDAARHIGATEDLSRRIEAGGDDEIGELARRFNEMLERLAASRDALDSSMRAQRQLIADASHELRTPVTSLRTNIEVLLEGGELAPGERERLLADVVAQTEELTALVSDLIDLARGEEPASHVEDVRLDALAEEAVARARRHAPGAVFETSLEPVVVAGTPERLARAVNNLLDNAARHAPPGSAISVTVDGSGVAVRDRGPGIAESDLPHIFDRFYRGAAARATAGSGLGLAIVRQVAETHGGRATAANAPDGGAVFRLELPVRRAEEAVAAGSSAG